MSNMGGYSVWSVSKWRDFETCPRMYHAKNVSKRWFETPNDGMIRGKRVHKDLEDAVKYGIDLPADVHHMTPLIDAFIGMKANGVTVYPEMKFGADIMYHRVEFFDGAELRARFVVDLFINDNGRLLIIDWKTGKRKSEHEEDARFYGAFAHICFGASKTSVQYYYIDNPAESFDVDMGPDEPTTLAAAWYKKFDYADKVIASAEVPANPCNACRWCGAWECPHNKNRKIQEAMGVE